jgi:hypothetical protein
MSGDGAKSKYGGMTVNERLVDAGLLNAFDDAARARDRGAMIRLLLRVDVLTPEFTADAILENPKRYGY